MKLFCDIFCGIFWGLKHAEKELRPHFNSCKTVSLMGHSHLLMQNLLQFFLLHQDLLLPHRLPGDLLTQCSCRKAGIYCFFRVSLEQQVIDASWWSMLWGRLAQTHYFTFPLKVLVQPFELGGSTRLIRSTVKNWRSGKFILFYLWYSLTRGA